MNLSRKAITLDDVARAAGVSAATVSRCLNSPGMVRPILKAKVDAAVEKLQYVPNGHARALASRRSRMMGAVFPSLDSTLFGGALETMQSEVAASGYTLVVASSGYRPEREREHIYKLIANGVDAILLVGAARDPEIYEFIRSKGIPYVLIWIADAGDGQPSIGFDNAAAAAEVARHLTDLGHRRIGVISGPVAGNDRAGARIEGIRGVLAQRGLSLPGESIIERPFGVDEGREAFRVLMARPHAPSAVICGSDAFAYGAIFESKALGVRIPEDVSVTGFDDMWLSSQIRPSLTTVRTPRRRMGHLAARYLLSVLDGEPVAPQHPLDVELIVRQSTAPPPSTAADPS